MAQADILWSTRLPICSRANGQGSLGLPIRYYVTDLELAANGAGVYDMYYYSN
jgi:hypothetical protein